MTNEGLLRFQKSRPCTGEEIRQAFLAFFGDRGHQVMPSASLVPEDPTVLLTIAGMLPFKRVFLGQVEAPSARATTSQKCIRTNDIENVGITARHHTFFEMLGNFSFGDYFKEEAIKWAWELSTEVFGLSPANLVISVFREDEEAESIWRDVVGVNSERIVRMDEADNFWSSGATGPCGPCSEIYYDFKPEMGSETIDLEDDSRFIEFYNLVFMEYNRDSEGVLTPLDKKNIDTGMGLERMAQILQGVPNNYETDLIYPLIKVAEELSESNYKQLDSRGQISLKVIADHSRAITHLICDGVSASNLGRGYVLRRLLRRVVRHGRLLGIAKPFLACMGDAAIQLMKSAYPQLLERRDVILAELQREEARFLETLERGEKLLADLLSSNPNQIEGKDAFELYDTYGFPLELTQEIAEENDLSVDIEGFHAAMDKQRQRAKAAAISIDLTIQDALDAIAVDSSATRFRGYEVLEHKGTVQALLVNGEPAQHGTAGDKVEVVLDITPFYGESGGQVGDRGELIGDGLRVQIDDVSRRQDVFIHSGRLQLGDLSIGDEVNSCVDQSSRRRAQANHTSTHLLQAALRQIVDADIAQAGSLVDFDRLRFDFHSPRSLTTIELEKVEKLINLWIADAHELNVQQMNLEKAKAAGAIAMFGEKYSDSVRVVDVPGVSMELCGGTHVSNTAEIGLFKIVSESGIAAGIRRIEAISGMSVLKYLNERDLVVKQLSEKLKTQPNEIVDRVLSLQDELRAMSKDLLSVTEELALNKAMTLVTQVQTIGSTSVLIKRLDGVGGDALQNAARQLLDQLGDSAAVVLGGVPDLVHPDKVVLVAAFGETVVSGGLQAGKFIGAIAKLCGGGGGGRPGFAQAGGRDAARLDIALEAALRRLTEELT